MQRHRQRQELLESLNLAGANWCTAPSFNDGPPLWAVVEPDELEGVVAKPLSSRYPGGATASSEEPRTVAVLGRPYWKYEL